jgi:hypothetical protein
MDQGDICMYEITYPSANSDWKVWVTSATDMEITVADGFQMHPYLYNDTNLTFITKLLNNGDEFELGDAWYNFTTGGKAYIFFRALSSGASANMNYG